MQKVSGSSIFAKRAHTIPVMFENLAKKATTSKLKSHIFGLTGLKVVDCSNNYQFSIIMVVGYSIRNGDWYFQF